MSIVGLWELTMASREVVERTLAPFQIFLAAAGDVFLHLLRSGAVWEIS